MSRWKIRAKRAMRYFSGIVHLFTGRQLIKTGFQLLKIEDYPVYPTPRYGYGKAPHPLLYEMIDRKRATYRRTLNRFLDVKDYLLKITVDCSIPSQEPCWDNYYFSGLDAVALYSFLYKENPARFFEIGSGYSTKFARRTISDHNLRTQITSVDPNPRTEIDKICDTVIRQPIESIDLKSIDRLQSGDFLFIDGSHRSFMNSDVVSVFLDILPRLKPGVIVQIHDIFLPYDYPPRWIKRYYSEQYLLAAYLLAKGKTFDVILPNVFITQDPELSQILNPIWDTLKLQGYHRAGQSFWMKIL